MSERNLPVEKCTRCGEMWNPLPGVDENHGCKASREPYPIPEPKQTEEEAARNLVGKTVIHLKWGRGFAREACKGNPHLLVVEFDEGRTHLLFSAAELKEIGPSTFNKSVHDLHWEFEYPKEYDALGFSSIPGVYVNKERLNKAEKAIRILSGGIESFATNPLINQYEQERAQSIMTEAKKILEPNRLKEPNDQISPVTVTVYHCLHRDTCRPTYAPYPFSYFPCITCNPIGTPNPNR